MHVARRSPHSYPTFFHSFVVHHPTRTKPFSNNLPRLYAVRTHGLPSDLHNHLSVRIMVPEKGFHAADETTGACNSHSRQEPSCIHVTMFGRSVCLCKWALLSFVLVSRLGRVGCLGSWAAFALNGQHGVALLDGRRVGGRDRWSGYLTIRHLRRERRRRVDSCLSCIAFTESVIP